MSRFSIYFLLFSFLVQGCIPGLQNYNRFSETDKRLYDIYFPSMTRNQRFEYLNLPTSQDRENFVKELGLHQKLHAHGPEVYEAILNRIVILDMPEEAVLFSLGLPTEQHLSTSALGVVKQLNYRTYLCGGGGPLVGEAEAQILAGPFGSGCVRYFKNITLQNGRVVNIFE